MYFFLNNLIKKYLIYQILGFLFYTIAYEEILDNNLYYQTFLILDKYQNYYN